MPTGRPQNFYERVLEDLDVVLLMGELALGGGRDGSQRGICRELAARGIKSPSGKLEWNAPTVFHILNNEVYSTGIRYYGKREFVAPKKFRKPDAERHQVRSVGKIRPREEWAGNVEMPGGSSGHPTSRQRSWMLWSAMAQYLRVSQRRFVPKVAAKPC